MADIKKWLVNGDVLKEIKVEKGAEASINCIYADNAGVLVKKGEENNIVQEINIKDNLQAPIYKGDKIGEVTYSLAGEKIQEVDIIAEKDIQKSNLWSVTTNLFNNWFKLNR